ncbi:MAG: RDD family protein [Candidatus Aenigmatarchaeota archaeon]
MAKSKNNYAGFWLRFTAWIIDALIVVAAVLVIAVPTGAITAFYTGFNSMLIACFILTAIVIGWLYCAGLESSKDQATIGKRTMNIKVVDEKGRRISFARATGRHFGKMLSSIILGIGYIMIGFTDKKQGLHDMLANTYVVRTK